MTSGPSDPPRRELQLRRGLGISLPVFLPVFDPRRLPVDPGEWQPRLGITGCILNAFLLYKDRYRRKLFEEGTRIHDYVGFPGFIMTDSGAFQGFHRPVYLRNAKIVRFQERIGADVVSPLDLVTPPGDNRRTAQRKMDATQRRSEEARALVDSAIVAGVQQGGRYPDLRRESLERLAATGFEYVALGSLVPFFNRRHDLSFVGKVIAEARRILGPEVVIHVYGAGEPVELPFFIAAGADVFDSSSYGHAVVHGLYMTPYGAVRDPGPTRGDWTCTCEVCDSVSDLREVMADPERLILHNLITILESIRTARAALEAGTLPRLLASILEVHSAWFPESKLGTSWEGLHE